LVFNDVYIFWYSSKWVAKDSGVLGFDDLYDLR